ncbi:MAG: FecR domain-containing protein [Saprospiraceae bacterium]|nr:FecR domain-containing protein [Saprospiraceae bacterium]
MSKENISIWVHKQLTGQLSAAEQEELDKALSSDASNQQLARDVQAVWEKTGTLGDDVQFDATKAFQRFKANVAAQSPRQEQVTPNVRPLSTSAGPRRIFLQYASAAAAVLVLGFFAIKWFGNNSNDIYTVESGASPVVAQLPDGSQIKLASGSIIQYNTADFAFHRNVKLQGSALFEVKKNGSPFEVSADNINVSVLGTTFVVKSEGATKEVKVLEGRVAVQTNASNRIEITGKQGVVLNNGQLTKVEDVDFSELSWSDPEMVYNNEPLSRVISDIEAKFAVKISFKGSSNIEKCPFTSGSLKNNTLEEIIKVLEAALSIKITKKSQGEYLISGGSCS